MIIIVIVNRRMLKTTDNMIENVEEEAIELAIFMLELDN